MVGMGVGLMVGGGVGNLMEGVLDDVRGVVKELMGVGGGEVCGGVFGVVGGLKWRV